MSELCAELTQENQRLTAERDELRAEVERLTRVLMSATNERDELRAEVDLLIRANIREIRRRMCY